MYALHTLCMYECELLQPSFAYGQNCARKCKNFHFLCEYVWWCTANEKWEVMAFQRLKQIIYIPINILRSLSIQCSLPPLFPLTGVRVRVRVCCSIIMSRLFHGTYSYGQRLHANGSNRGLWLLKVYRIRVESSALGSQSVGQKNI